MQYDGIAGKVAIVTGAGGGIGEGYAKGLASHGAKVVVAEIKKENGERVAEEIRTSGGDALFVEVDVGSPESTTAMAAAAIDAYGGIDFLINNAAIFGDMKLDSLLHVDWDYYQNFMNVNMNGALLCTRACRKRTAAWMGVGYYGLAKLGINGITHALSRELGAQGIRVNAIAPGPTDTQALQNTAGAAAGQIVAQLAIPRLGQPDDMVSMVLFLLSDAASWVTGQIISVDGGQITRP
ncbi:MAG: SDR family oxidoreductase [Deltaproteobacteria bacterium]|nr:SDR family oxidoreductase [Deltaproteobacteria bacterium]